MPETQSEQRHSPYTTLRGTADADAAKARGEVPANAAQAAEPDYLAAEADKLKNLKEALFTAFLAAPKLGIPTALVDLAATYTSALKLQLSLRGYSAVPKKPTKSQIFGVSRK